MATKTQKIRTPRYEGLRLILEERRLEIIGEVQHKMRNVRVEGAAVTHQGISDETESSGVEIQDDIEFALLQMRAETLSKITEALERLEGGTYGDCYECGNEIAESRLRALPFAVRCKDCEEVREVEQGRERLMADRRGWPSLFTDMIN